VSSILYSNAVKCDGNKMRKRYLKFSKVIDSYDPIFTEPKTGRKAICIWRARTLAYREFLHPLPTTRKIRRKEATV